MLGSCLMQEGNLEATWNALNTFLTWPVISIAERRCIYT